MNIKRELEEKLIGKSVSIVDKKHPWYGCRGKVISIDRTFAGLGIKVFSPDKYVSFYVFNSREYALI